MLSQWAESRSTLLGALAVTTYEAAAGWVIGALLALLSGTVTVFIRSLRTGVLHVAVVVNSIPAIALGPVLIAILPHEVAPTALAAISVYFTTLVAGLRALAGRYGTGFHLHPAKWPRRRTRSGGRPGRRSSPTWTRSTASAPTSCSSTPSG